MSEENVNVARRAIGAYQRRDYDDLLGHLDETIEFRSAIVGGASGAVYYGHAGVREWIAVIDETFDEAATRVTEFRDLGDRVLALGTLHARGRQSGLEVDSPTGWVMSFREGKISKAMGFLSRTEALQAAGLAK